MDRNAMTLLRGNPISLDNMCKVYPLKLEKVEEIGEDKYNQYLSVLMLDKSSLNIPSSIDERELEEINKLSSYDILLIHAYRDEYIRRTMEDALSVFLKETILYLRDSEYPNGCFFIIDFQDIGQRKEIKSDTFDLIKKALKKQNYLNDEEKKDFKPANDKAKELIEKMQKVKEKLKKNNNEDGLNLSDIISIVSAYSPDINILTVWDLTVYQLYESYIRLIMWDQYHNDHIHLPHMDENDRKSLKHWATKTKIN
jgi:hypothetical protein